MIFYRKWKRKNLSMNDNNGEKSNEKMLKKNRTAECVGCGSI